MVRPMRLLAVAAVAALSLVGCSSVKFVFGDHSGVSASQAGGQLEAEIELAAAAEVAVSSPHPMRPSECTGRCGTSRDGCYQWADGFASQTPAGRALHVKLINNCMLQYNQCCVVCQSLPPGPTVEVAGPKAHRGDRLAKMLGFRHPRASLVTESSVGTPYSDCQAQAKANYNKCVWGCGNYDSTNCEQIVPGCRDDFTTYMTVMCAPLDGNPNKPSPTPAAESTNTDPITEAGRWF